MQNLCLRVSCIILSILLIGISIYKAESNLEIVVNSEFVNTDSILEIIFSNPKIDSSSCYYYYSSYDSKSEECQKLQRRIFYSTLKFYQIYSKTSSRCYCLWTATPYVKIIFSIINITIFGFCLYELFKKKENFIIVAMFFIPVDVILSILMFTGNIWCIGGFEENTGLSNWMFLYPKSINSLVILWTLVGTEILTWLLFRKYIEEIATGNAESKALKIIRIGKFYTTVIILGLVVFIGAIELPALYRN